MTYDPKLAEIIKREELLRLRPYMDTEGKVTIGYGRNLSDVGINTAEAEAMFARDIADADRGVQQRLPWATQLDPVRYAVLVDMAFNMGIDGLLTFKNTLREISVGAYGAAAAKMLDSKWAIQVGGRAVRLSEMMRTGEWPKE